ncbi:MAG: FkbM family methyltransferase [Desulfurococcaceae archaeon]
MIKQKILNIVMLIRQICECVRTFGFYYTLRLSIIILTQLLPITAKNSRFKIARYRCSCGYIFFAYYSDWWRFIKHFEPKTITFLRSVVDNDKIVIDIGAHIGLHAIHLAKKAKLVICLEPEPNNYRLLKINVKMNKLDNIIVLPIAASNKDDYVILYLSERSSGAHTLEYSRSNLIQSRKNLRVLSRKVDTLLEQLGIRNVDIVKIDVEGHEEKVIEGMIELLKRGYPKVFVVETMKGSNLLTYLCSRYGYRITSVLECWNNSCNYALTLQN